MIDYRVHKTAKVAKGVRLGAFVVVCEGAIIHERVTVDPFVYIAPGVVIGEDAELMAHACVLANVAPGAIIEPGEVWRGATPIDIRIETPPKVLVDEVVRRLEKPIRGRK